MMSQSRKSNTCFVGHLTYEEFRERLECTCDSELDIEKKHQDFNQDFYTHDDRTD